MINKYLKIFIFLILFFISDSLVSHFLYYLYSKSNEFQTAKLRYTINECKSDIILLGSSRAQNQFVTETFEKTCKWSSYNYGFSGQGLDFSFIQLYKTLSRHKPKLIILDISSNILIDENSKDKMKILLPYSLKDSFIKYELINNINLNLLSQNSNVYLLNSTLLSSLRGLFQNFNDLGKGYQPLIGKLDTTKVSLDLSNIFKKSKIPQKNLSSLLKIINLCNKRNIKLILVFSPVYMSNNTLLSLNSQIKFFIAKSKNTTLLDFTYHKKFYKNKNLFYNNLHLNHEGSILFSQILSESLCNYKL